MKRVILIFVFVICIGFISGCQNTIGDENINNENNIKENEDMEEFVSKINIIIDNQTFSATLEDNETSREFVKMLPLDITMSELNGNEKYYYFDHSLPSNASKVGKVSAGDIMLYGSDCLVLFYDSFNTSYSYTRIGKLDASLDLKSIVGKGNIKISISK